MSKQTPSAPFLQGVSWEEAVREFLLHKRAAYAAKTVRYYEVQLKELVRWAEAEGVAFEHFGKRHMDRYTAFRISQGKARLTLHHDGVCAKNLFDWCAKNDLLDRSKLSEYQVHNAPKPHKHMPSDEEVTALLQAIREYWDPEKHPVSGIRSMPGPARLFHKTRNAALFMGLIDTACRVGEALHLKVGDVKLTEASVVIREAKGKEPRTLPIGPEWAEGWLFVSETGTRLDEIRILETLRRITTFAGLTQEITLHSLRRYSLNKLAQHNLLMAQTIAGHKDTRTTLGYTRLDPEFVRATHREASPLGSVMSNRHHPPTKKRRLV
jgi:integrase/recombinase XerD